MEIIECPFCIGEIPSHAKKCKHCGEWLTNDRGAFSGESVNPAGFNLASMSSADLVKYFVPRIEKLLKDKFNAEGAGLIEQMNSINYLLPVNLQDKIRQIGWMRNKVFHEHGFEIANKSLYAAACEGILSELDKVGVKWGQTFRRSTEITGVQSEESAATVREIAGLCTFKPDYSQVKPRGDNGAIYSRPPNANASNALQQLLNGFNGRILIDPPRK